MRRIRGIHSSRLRFNASPEKAMNRFHDKHKAGIQANRFVTQYGLRLLPDLYEGFNPMSYEDAVDREIEIGIDLRSAGFGVWQA